MKKSSTFFVIMSIFALGIPSIGVCQIHDDPVSRPVSGRDFSNVRLHWAMIGIASELASTSNPTVLIHENWGELLMPTHGADGELFLVGNPLAPTIKVDAHGKKIGYLLDEVVRQHGSLTWQYDRDENAIHVIENHLAADKRWGLSDLLGEDAAKDLSFQQAQDILSQKHGLSLGEDEIFLAYRGDKNVIVWHAGKKKNPTARDLLVAMIKLAYKKDFYYFVKVTPDHNPQTGYDGLKDRKTLMWTAGNYPLLGVADYNARVRLLKSFAPPKGGKPQVPPSIRRNLYEKM